MLLQQKKWSWNDTEKREKKMNIEGGNQLNELHQASGDEET